MRFENEHSRDQRLGNTKAAPAATGRKPAKTSTSKRKGAKPAPKSNPRISLESGAVQNLWTGRPKGEKGQPFIRGAEGTVRRLSNLEGAKAQGDPWAAQTYQKLEARIQRGLEELEQIDREIDALEVIENPKVQFAANETEFTPKSFEIAQRSDIGWRFINMMVEADDRVCDIIDARDCGKLDINRARVMINTCTKQVRAITSMIGEWKYTGVTAADVAANNELAQKATAAMGELSNSVKPKPASFIERLFG